MILHCELDGLICSGKRQGNQFTYALLDERAEQGKNLNREESLAELARRYVMSRGPATLKDFSNWSGLPIKDCRVGLELSKSWFDRITLDKSEYYISNRLKMNADLSYNIFLLPVYDEFIMGYKDRSAILEFKHSLEPEPPLRFESTIIQNGQITGTWRRTPGKKQINLEYDFFAPPDKSQKLEFEKIVRRFGDFNKMTINTLQVEEGQINRISRFLLK
ncbi:MAG: crosslink repair DNA glycosylase YcaQ family protein, partial [Bacteroidales bacterium]